MTFAERASIAYNRYHSLLEVGDFEGFNLMLAMEIKNWYPNEKLSVREELGVIMSQTIRKLYYGNSR